VSRIGTRFRFESARTRTVYCQIQAQTTSPAWRPTNDLIQAGAPAKENCALDQGLSVDSEAASGKQVRHHDDNCDQKSEAGLKWELGNTRTGS